MQSPEEADNGPINFLSAVAEFKALNASSLAARVSALIPPSGLLFPEKLLAEQQKLIDALAQRIEEQNTQLARCQARLPFASVEDVLAFLQRAEPSLARTPRFVNAARLAAQPNTSVATAMRLWMPLAQTLPLTNRFITKTLLSYTRSNPAYGCVCLNNMLDDSDLVRALQPLMSFAARGEAASATAPLLSKARMRKGKAHVLNFEPIADLKHFMPRQMDFAGEAATAI